MKTMSKNVNIMFASGIFLCQEFCARCGTGELCLQQCTSKMQLKQSYVRELRT